MNLHGLITLKGLGDLKFVIDANTIRVYTPSRQSGKSMLFISLAST